MRVRGVIVEMTQEQVDSLKALYEAACNSPLQEAHVADKSIRDELYTFIAAFSEDL